MSQLKTAVPETRINIRVENGVKKNAEYIFNKLGLNLSEGINIYLRSVIANKGIPFPLTLSREDIIGEEAVSMETAFDKAVKESIAQKKSKGLPVARYDAEKKQAFLEYPDGRREY
jgi:DNA-damage-inducible protein J